MSKAIISDISVRDSSHNPARAIPWRWVLVGFDVLLPLSLIAAFGREGKEALFPHFREGGVVEICQALHLAAAVSLMLAAVWLRRVTEGDRPLAACMAIALLWALNRELDGVWEKRKLDFIYDGLKIVIGLTGVAVAVWRFDACWQSWQARKFSPALVLFYAGVGGYVLAQVVARSMEWWDLRKTPRRTVQESIELLACAAFVLSAARLFLDPAQRRGSEDADDRDGDAACGA